MDRPAVGVFGLTGCAGDQLVLLNCEDELLDLVAALDLRDFLMASSERDSACELDLAFVDGAVMSRSDEERLREIRRRSRLLVALGTCAVWGGVAAIGGDRWGELLEEVYGEIGRRYDSLPARPLHEVVPVDVRITGCPIEKRQLLDAVAHLLNGDPPVFPDFPVCTECKIRENGCVLINNKEICCGPLTQAGCAARCPSFGVPCVGCRGPSTDANAQSAWALFEENGISRADIARKLRAFAPLDVGMKTEVSA
jgi:sulfhydrogenase subunit delta